MAGVSKGLVGFPSPCFPLQVLHFPLPQFALMSPPPATSPSSCLSLLSLSILFLSSEISSLYKRRMIDQTRHTHTTGQSSENTQTTHHLFLSCSVLRAQMQCKMLCSTSLLPRQRQPLSSPPPPPPPVQCRGGRGV